MIVMVVTVLLVMMVVAVKPAVTVNLILRLTDLNAVIRQLQSMV